MPSKQTLQKYRQEKAEPFVLSQNGTANVLLEDVLAEQDGLVRHDVEKLSRVLTELIGRVDTQR